MILQIFSWDDGAEGLRIDHGDGSASVICERPDGTGWSVHLSGRALHSLRQNSLREKRSRAGRASAAARRKLHSPNPQPEGGPSNG